MSEDKKPWDQRRHDQSVVWVGLRTGQLKLFKYRERSAGHLAIFEDAERIKDEGMLKKGGRK